MSELEFMHSKVDVELLKKVIDASTAMFAKRLNVSPNALTNYTRSDLANSSRIIYSYLVKDCKNDSEKLVLFTDEKLMKYAEFVNEQYNSLLSNRNKSLSEGMRLYSEFSFSLESALTYMIDIVSPLSKLNPRETLMPDLFKKFFSQALGLLRMLNLDLSSEAYSNWRTLHEAECVIKLLVEGGKPLQDVYITHLIYNNAFRHAIPSKEETDNIFVEIKKGMANHGLKSKDMKKFIEYGWLYSCKNYHEDDVSYKLNFRNGLQKAAGLGEYNAWYEMASEMAHSSPIFFYSNNTFFSDLTSVNLADISIRSIKYFKDFLKSVNLGFSVKAQTMMDILVNNLQIQVKKEDDSFYTKYKDYLEDDNSDSSSNGDEE